MNALEAIVLLLKSVGIITINLVGKSLRGIVASYYLDSKRVDKEIIFNLGILGFVLVSVKAPTGIGKLVVVQGEKDRFGNSEEVAKALANSNIDKTILEIFPCLMPHVAYFSICGFGQFLSILLVEWRCHIDLLLLA